jgi:DNA-binding PucR family transcriptional regulator
MWRLAAAMTRRAIETDRAEQLSLLSAGELLNQLLDSADDGSSSLLRRAADVGIRVDAWNQIIVLEFANLLTLADEDAVTAYHYAQTLIRVVAQTASHHEGRWTVAPRAGGAVVLRTAAHADSPSALRKLKSTVGTMIDRAVEVFPAVEILCGIGGSHEGLQGMQASRAEAESALQSARLRGTVNQPTLFDAPGLSRLLVEWYSSTSVRQSIDDLLAPLNALGEAKQKEYVRTLRVYLENNRSVGRTSQQLYVHRNTVAYRISRILAVLDVDLDDPNQFLAIYLACYARSMPHATARGDAEPSGRARG